METTTNNNWTEKVAARVRIASPPGWVQTHPVDMSFAPAERGHLTVLLMDSQYHAETGDHYRRVVQRLETMHAVQDLSQFKLDFDPASQEVKIHSITVVRGENRTEHACERQFHFLQREQSLESFVIHGWATLLLLLNDVRVGDIIDSSCTIKSTPKLLPERFGVLHGLPLGVPVKALRVSLCFAKSRSMQWKSSSKDLEPSVQESADETRWEWKRENLMDAFPEPNLPNWFLAGSWIQMTDCESWETVANACVTSWPLADVPADVRQLAQAINTQANTADERIERVINFVQDEFRYLSVELGLGGQIPSPPDDVLRRRFGDCKDLTALTVLLLRSLGIPAHPVLVHTMLAKRVQDLLPMPGAFNHVVVEYEIEKERRWVDPIRRLQGGGARYRPISNFGFGLAIQTGEKELQPAPNQSKHDGIYRLKESFWLNTASSWSILEVVVSATGSEAESLRNVFANKPVNTIVEERNYFYAQMFPQIKRLGRIAWKDDRKTDEFTFAELYEVAGAVRPTGNGETCFFPFTFHLANRVFRVPLNEERRYPCALPFPYNVEHMIELDFPGRLFRATPAFAKSHPVFRLSRKSRAAQGFYNVSYSLQTAGDNILPEQFASFRKAVDEVWPESSAYMELPLGVSGRKPRHRLPVV